MNKISWVEIVLLFVSFWAGYSFAALTIAAKKGDDADGSPTHNAIESDSRPSDQAEK